MCSSDLFPSHDSMLNLFRKHASSSDNEDIISFATALIAVTETTKEYLKLKGIEFTGITIEKVQ